jgi:hypothetical protein
MRVIEPGLRGCTVAYTPSYSRRWIPSGPEGTRQTLQVMRDLAQRDSLQPKIQTLAYWLGSPENVESFLRTNWVVRPDPVDAEYIESPFFQMMQFEEGHLFMICTDGSTWPCTSPLSQLIEFDKEHYFAGDCDDASTLAASLLHALGWPCSFVAYRLPNHNEFSHVNLHCPLGAGIELEIDPVTPLEQLPIRGTAETMVLTL